MLWLRLDHVYRSSCTARGSSDTGGAELPSWHQTGFLEFLKCEWIMQNTIESFKNWLYHLISLILKSTCVLFAREATTFWDECRGEVHHVCIWPTESLVWYNKDDKICHDSKCRHMNMFFMHTMFLLQPYGRGECKIQKNIQMTRPLQGWFLRMFREEN